MKMPHTSNRWGVEHVSPAKQPPITDSTCVTPVQSCQWCGKTNQFGQQIVSQYQFFQSSNGFLKVLANAAVQCRWTEQPADNRERQDCDVGTIVLLIWRERRAEGCCGRPPLEN